MGLNLNGTYSEGRTYFDAAKKPELKAALKQATKGAKVTGKSTYHPFNKADKYGQVTKYSNGVQVTVWDCTNANGVTTKATSIKIGKNTFIDWESDGKIDCVDTPITPKKTDETNNSMQMFSSGVPTVFQNMENPNGPSQTSLDKGSIETSSEER